MLLHTIEHNFMIAYYVFVDFASPVSRRIGGCQFLAMTFLVVRRESYEGLMSLAQLSLLATCSSC